MNTALASQTRPRAVSGATRLAAAVSLICGLGVVYLIGFANASALHNAAHDSRHTLAFPCH